MKNKKIIIGALGGITVIITLLFLLIINNNNNNNILSNNEIELDPNTFAIMLETDAWSGQYEQSTSSRWPSSGYEYNENLSYCENGSSLIWNEETWSVNLSTGITDKCYLYFDVIPPDVTVNTNNTNNTYNLSTPASLSCTGATAEYNQKYQRIEISQINRYTSCNLTYEQPSSRTYLNNHIIGLSGTTQGTGEVVDEGTATYGDFSSTTLLTQTQYGTPTMYSSSSGSSTSGTTTTGTWTFSNNNWTSVPSAMASSTYYHIQVTPPTDGYYQICYEMSSGSSSNFLYAYKGTTNQNLGGSAYVSASSSSAKSGCQSLGYLSTSDTIRVVQRAYTTIATTSFRLERANSTYDLDLGIRYEGKDPNNYIWFNDELWRIIGVFDSDSHGVSGQNLVKIIRANSIGRLAWHRSGTNDWTSSSLKSLLNNAYLNSENATGTTNCAGFSTNVPGNCNYTESGINDTYRPMIENVTWYLGGYSGTAATAEAFYGYERETTVYSDRPTSTTGYIGLMYPSDYGYSVLASSCARTTDLISYGNSICTGQSWLYGQGSEWTITLDSDTSNYVFYVYNVGVLSNHYVYGGATVRPVLYLDYSVYVYDGNGSISDPYIIGMG